MNKKKFIYILFIIILCTVIVIPVFFIFREKEDEDQLKSEETLTDFSRTQFREVDFKLYNNDKTVRWELKARTLAHEEENNHLNLSPVEVSVFANNKNELLYKFTADRGNYSGKEKRLEISGPVEIKMANYQLKAGSLTWKQEKDIIKLANSVKITTPEGCVISGEVLFTDSYLDSLAIQGSDEKQATICREGQEDEKN